MCMYVYVHSRLVPGCAHVEWARSGVCVCERRQIVRRAHVTIEEYAGEKRTEGEGEGRAEGCDARDVDDRP